MKLKALKSIELKAIEFPERVDVPGWADKNNLADRIFGAFCRINPELPCMEDKKFIKRVFTCIKKAGGKDLLTNNEDLISFVKKDKEIQKWRNWYQIQKDQKAEYRKNHKEEIKKENEERKAKYGIALVNGIEEPLGSWIVEPESIFFGRGDSPLNGLWKQATKEEDVIVNTNSKNLPVVIKNKKETNSKNYKVEWNPEAHVAASYKILVGYPNSKGVIEKPEYIIHKNIMFGASSSIKKEGQEKKYAASSELGKSYEKILKQIDYNIKNSKDLDTTIAVFFLFEKGIRIGQKNPTQNNTKGLLSLEWNKDVKRIDNKIKFDFYGKDSVHDLSVIETEYAPIIEKVWSKSKKLNTTKEEIKSFIGKLVPEIADVFTPKLCRTAVAAYTTKNALDEMTNKYKITKDSPIAIKKIAIDEATMKVAKRLNHQRGVNKVAEEKRKAKFKEAEDKLKERKDKVKEQIKNKETQIELLKNSTSKVIVATRKERIKSLKESIEKLKTNLKTSELKLDSKERNQNFTSSTAKSAYIDPEIIKEWCNRFELPLEKVYTKTQMKQFFDK